MAPIIDVLLLVVVRPNEELDQNLNLRIWREWQAQNHTDYALKTVDGDISKEHQEECIDCDVEGKRRKYVAWIVVGPYAELDRDDDGSIHEEASAHDHHAWAMERQSVQERSPASTTNRHRPCMNLDCG